MSALGTHRRSLRCVDTTCSEGLLLGYEVSVATGDKSESETYNHVWVTLHGDEGTSDRVWFHNSAKRTLLRRYLISMRPCTLNLESLIV